MACVRCLWGGAFGSPGRLARARHRFPRLFPPFPVGRPTDNHPVATLPSPFLARRISPLSDTVYMCRSGSVRAVQGRRRSIP